MDSIQITGFVDDQHRLSADVPASIEPGPITVWLSPTAQEDDAGDSWMAGIRREWLDELNDVRQDIYTISDGEPLGPS